MKFSDYKDALNQADKQLAKRSIKESLNCTDDNCDEEPVEQEAVCPECGKECDSNECPKCDGSCKEEVLKEETYDFVDGDAEYIGFNSEGMTEELISEEDIMEARDNAESNNSGRRGLGDRLRDYLEKRHLLQNESLTSDDVVKAAENQNFDDLSIEELKETLDELKALDGTKILKGLAGVNMNAWRDLLSKGIQDILNKKLAEVKG